MNSFAKKLSVSCESLVSLLEILQITEPIRSSGSAVNQKIRATDKFSATAHQKFCQVADFIGRAGSFCGRRL